MTIKPYNTARTRKKPSYPLRLAFGNLWVCWGHSVLDYGCGRGSDVQWLNARDGDAEGYDPHEPFGYSEPPSRAAYQVVLCTYVINVLDTVEARKRVIVDAWKRVAPNGKLVLTSRSAKDIKASAKRGGWPAHNDGYWSRQNRGMFQKGHTLDEMLSLVGGLGRVIGRIDSGGFVMVAVEKAGLNIDPLLVVGDVLEDSS